MRKLTTILWAALWAAVLISPSHAAAVIETGAVIDFWEFLKDCSAAFVGAALAITIMAVYQKVFHPVVAPNLDEANTIVASMAENTDMDARARAQVASTVLWTNTIKMGVACLVAMFFTLLL